ncbi:hypothetical protein CMV_014605 [Castanea mollissima]|uniref:Uncharacterized protein n=1 Tax=Castanea mollissima TaxID=60419 RepID=A0A8J4RBU8_9ROSI|nr:hypothetical protein CMV_014605 [Castanea mollissima]
MHIHLHLHRLQASRWELSGVVKNKRIKNSNWGRRTHPSKDLAPPTPSSLTCVDISQFISSDLCSGDGSSGYGGRSIEKEKEKKKPQTFLLHLGCV